MGTQLNDDDASERARHSENRQLVDQLRDFLALNDRSFQWRAGNFHRAAVLDLSYEEHDRIYGRAWLKFICSCKTMLGTESGASVFDFT